MALMVDPGKMRYRVALQAYVSTLDTLKNEIAAWETIRTMNAAVNSLYGEEYWQAARQGQQDSIVFTVRWSPALAELAKAKDLTRYRIVLDGVPYKILSYDDVEYRHVLVKIRAVNNDEQLQD